jgi:hypothetical protein
MGHPGSLPIGLGANRSTFKKLAIYTNDPSGEITADGTGSLGGVLMKQLDADLLKRFLKLAADTLEGNWLLIGGTLLPAVGIQIRSTIDIDLVGLTEKESKQGLEVMSLAEKLGLGVEVINQAAAFFVNKVGYKKTDLIVLQKGKSATIFRPSVMLYWKLKLSRLTESDAMDCQHYLAYCFGQKDDVDVKVLRALLKSSAKGSEPLAQEKLNRLNQLEHVITAQSDS